MPDKNDSTFFSQVKYIEQGPITFNKLKEGNYSVLAYTSSDNQYVFSSTPYRDTVVTIKANTVEVELLAGIQFFFHSGTEYKGAVSYSNLIIRPSYAHKFTRGNGTAIGLLSGKVPGR